VLISAEGGANTLGKFAEEFDKRLVGHTDAAYAVAMTLDGRLLATGGADTRVRLWDLARGEQLASAAVCAQPVRFLSWIDEGRALVAVDAEGRVTLLDSVPRRTRLAESTVQASTR
jgi:WD40 repeat protein